MKILLVDDEQGIRRTIPKFLDHFGHEVIVAEEGEEGIKRLEEMLGIGMILCDCRLPGMSGFEFLQWVRRHHPRMPVVLMSGYDDEDFIAAEEQYGVYCLRKPFDLQQLLAYIESIENAPDNGEETIETAVPRQSL